METILNVMREICWPINVELAAKLAYEYLTLSDMAEITRAVKETEKYKSPLAHFQQSV